ncbi:hypothetical protein BASA62_006354 [Batrachochytrium salamandrivorans]|nr:hypothetical protein BASA62_006354 [Batrachochytrium salamandrivorans]
MKIACVCQHCGHQIVHRKKWERTVFASAEMQSFSEGNDVIRLNQIDLTGSTMPRQTREGQLELVQTQAYHKVPVKTYSILQYTLPKLMKKGLGQD